jgi:hypothetical protein
MNSIISSQGSFNMYYSQCSPDVGQYPPEKAQSPTDLSQHLPEKVQSPMDLSQHLTEKVQNPMDLGQHLSEKVKSPPDDDEHPTEKSAKQLGNWWHTAFSRYFTRLRRSLCALQDSMSCNPDAKAPAYGQGL